MGWGVSHPCPPSPPWGPCSKWVRAPHTPLTRPEHQNQHKGTLPCCICPHTRHIPASPAGSPLQSGALRAWDLERLFLGQRGALLVLTSSPVRGANFRKAVGLPGSALGDCKVASAGAPAVTASGASSPHRKPLGLCSFQTHPVPLRYLGLTSPNSQEGEIGVTGPPVFTKDSGFTGSHEQAHISLTAVWSHSLCPTGPPGSAQGSLLNPEGL